MDLVDEPGVAGEAEQVVDLVHLAPGHQRFAGKPAVAAQQDLDLGPALANAPDYPVDFLHRARAGVDVRATELGCQQVLAADHVKRQVAVAVVVAVEKPAFLAAVDGVVGGVQIERDARRHLGMRIQEQVHEQVFDRRGIVRDLAVAVAVDRGVLQPVQRALARQRRAA